MGRCAAAFRAVRCHRVQLLSAGMDRHRGPGPHIEDVGGPCAVRRHLDGARAARDKGEAALTTVRARMAGSATASTRRHCASCRWLSWRARATRSFCRCLA